MYLTPELRVPYEVTPRNMKADENYCYCSSAWRQVGHSFLVERNTFGLALTQFWTKYRRCCCYTYYRHALRLSLLPSLKLSPGYSWSFLVWPPKCHFMTSGARFQLLFVDGCKCEWNSAKLPKSAEKHSINHHRIVCYKIPLWPWYACKVREMHLPHVSFRKWKNFGNGSGSRKHTATTIWAAI